MITVDGNRITVDTSTQTVCFENGRMTSIISKCDGKRYLHDTNTDTVPLSIVYPFDRTLPIGGAEHCRTSVTVYSGYVVILSFGAWNGHGEIRIEEERETGAVCVTPSVHTSREGVLACRWEFCGINPELFATIPSFQGIRIKPDDPLINWPIFKDLRYPYRWEDNFIAFGDDCGGFWIHCEGAKNRFKHLHLGSESTPYCAAIDIQNYGPVEDKLSAGGVTWKINTYTGDWTVPVLNYRNVLMRSPDWIRSKQTLPDWFEEIKLAYSWCPTDCGILDTLKRYIDPKHVLIHLYNWRIYKYDQHYPDYTSSAEAKEFIRKGVEMGYHIAPHFNCYEIDPSLPEFELVRDFRYRDVESGQVWGWGFRYNNTDWGIPEDNLTLRSSRDRNVMTKIHPALDAWKNLLAGNIKKAVDENGLDMVFLDTSHNTLNLKNELVNDTTTIDGVRDLFSIVEKINGGISAGGEGMNETLLFQHFAQGHSIMNGPEHTMLPPDKYVPVNHILFGDLCHIIGYHAQKDRERRILQDKCDDRRGFIPTLLKDDIYTLDEKDSVAKQIIVRALG